MHEKWSWNLLLIFIIFMKSHPFLIKIEEYLIFKMLILNSKAKMFKMFIGSEAYEL